MSSSASASSLLPSSQQAELVALQRRLALHTAATESVDHSEQKQQQTHGVYRTTGVRFPSSPSHYLQEKHAMRAQESTLSTFNGASFLPPIPVLGTHSPINKRTPGTNKSPMRAIVSEQDALLAQASVSPEESPVRQALRFAESEDGSPRVVKEHRAKHTHSTNDTPALLPPPTFSDVDPFASFSPAVNSRASSAAANAPMPVAPAAVPSALAPHITYMEWKLPSSLVAPSLRPSVAKKLLRSSRPAAAATGVNTLGHGSEYVLSVLDEVDPPLNTLAIYLDSWLSRYIDEPSSFDSPSVFVSVKYEEVRHLLAKLHRPNSFRTWIACDLLMKLIANLPDTEATIGGGAKNARTLAQTLLEHLLVHVYTRTPAKNFGFVPYQLHARQTLIHVHDRTLQRAEALIRVREFHLHRRKIIDKWQPCIARAARTWHTPILAVCFLRWRRWRIARMFRGITRSRVPEWQFDDVTFFARFRLHRRRALVRTDALVAFLGWKVHVGCNHLEASLMSMADLRNTLGGMQEQLAAARTMQTETEEKLRALVQRLWEAQHAVQELQCRIREEQETHRVHADQRGSTLILTQWYRYLFLHLTSNHQRSFDGAVTMNFQDTAVLLSDIQAMRMRTLFEGFKRQGDELPAFSSLRQMMKRSNSVAPRSGSATPIGVSKRSSLRGPLLLSPTSGTSVAVSPSRRRTIATNAFDAALRSSNAATARNSLILASPAGSTLGSPSLVAGANESVQATLNLDQLTAATGVTASTTAPSSETPSRPTTRPSSRRRLRVQSPPDDARTIVVDSPRTTISVTTATGTSSSSPGEQTPARRGGRIATILNQRRNGPVAPSPSHGRGLGGDDGLLSMAGSAFTSATTTSETPVRSAAISRIGSGKTRAVGFALTTEPAEPSEAIRVLSPQAIRARQRWRMSTMAVILSLRTVPESEEAAQVVGVIYTAKDRAENDALMLHTWMRHQVQSWKSSLLVSRIADNNTEDAAEFDDTTPITQAHAERFVKFLVNHTQSGDVPHSRPLQWSAHLVHAITPAQQALTPTDDRRLLPVTFPSPPTASLPPMKPTPTSNVNLVTQCPAAHPYLALNASELHSIKVGMAQVLGVGFINTGAGPAAAVALTSPTDEPPAPAADAPSSYAADLDSGLFHATWLRLFTAMPSLPCDIEGNNSLDFDSFMMRLAECEGLSRSMLQAASSHLSRSSQLQTFLSMVRSLRFALKKKRTQMTRSHATFLVQKQTTQAVVATKLSQLIKDAEREAKNNAAKNAGATAIPVDEVEEDATSPTAAGDGVTFFPPVVTSAVGMGSVLLSRRASITMSLGTSLMSSLHPNMAAAEDPLNSTLSVAGSVGLSAINSSAPSALASQQATRPASPRTTAETRAEMANEVEQANSALSPVADMPDDTEVGSPHEAPDTDAPSTTAGDAAPSRVASPGPNAGHDDSANVQTSETAPDSSAPLGDSAQTDQAQPAIAAPAAAVADGVVKESLTPSSRAVLNTAGTSTPAAAARTTSASSGAIVGEGEMQGLEDLPVTSSPISSEPARTKPHVPAAAYEVEIIHATLVALVNEEESLRGGALSTKASARSGVSAAQASWSVVGHAVEVRRCEVLLATHLSQLRKWYRTCLGDEVRARGKVKSKLLAPGSDILLVTRDKVMKLFQRAKLMNAAGIKGAFTNATITQAWNEIAAWRSEKRAEAEEAAAPAVATVSASTAALSFDASVALLCKLSVLRFRPRVFGLSHVSERLNAFLQLCFPLQVLPYTSMASKFYPLQAALANANKHTTVGTAQNRVEPKGLGTDATPAQQQSAPPPMAYLGAQSAFEGDENEEALVRRLCDDVLRANHKWLNYLFQYYATEKEVVSVGATSGAMEPAMSRDNFMTLVEDSTWLSKKIIYLRTINSLWIAQQQTQAAELAAELAANPNAKQPVQGSDTLMTYRHFLDALRVVCTFFARDPMIPLPVKLDRLVAFMWSCPGFERCRVSMGVSMQNSAASNQAQAQLMAAKERQENMQEQTIAE